MKKHLLSLFALASMVFASSCSQEEVISQSTGNEVAVTFKAEMRTDVKSRFVGDDTDHVNTLVFAVYDENEVLLPSLTQTIDEFQTGDKAGTKKVDITVVLVKGQTYSFAFWAQDSTYTAYQFDAESATVGINYGQTANNKSADAYFAKVNELTVTGTFEQTVTLKRPFAQVNFLTTEYDLTNAKAAGFEPLQSSVVIENAATALNLLTGDVTGDVKATFTVDTLINESTTIKNSNNSYITWNGISKIFQSSTDIRYAQNFKYLATAYFLPTLSTGETQITASMDVRSSVTSKAPVTLTAADIKAKRNFRTNIYGNLLTSNGTFHVVIDPEFDGDYSVEDVEDTTLVVSTIEEANALFAKGETNVTITETPDAASTIYLPASNDDATVNFAFEEGFTPVEITIEYPTGATVTPDNVEVNGNAGDLIIDAPQSTVTLNGEYTSVTATTKPNTLYVPKGVKIGTLTLKQGNAEIYYGAVTNLVEAAGYNGKITYLVDAGENFAAAITGGDAVKLLNDIEVDADNTITIVESTNKTLDLDGKILAGVTDQSDKNRVMIDVRGTLNVNNGTVTYVHEGEDMKWNAMVEPFYVGFNGTLNVNDVTIENMGGSAMAYCIDLVNETNTTLNIQNSTIKSTYIPVRVFNNGSGMNNVTIENSTLDGKFSFWVHIFTTVDNGKNGIKDTTLNFDIYNKGNTFKYSADAPAGIIYGFSSTYYYNEAGELVAVEIEDGNDLQSALDYATEDITISLLTDVTADVTVTQKANQTINLLGNKHKYNGVITVDGKSATITSAGFTISDVNFVADAISADACIRLGDGTNATRYTCNVTVSGCTFDVPGAVGVKSYTGGDKNLTITGCTATEKAHSLVQAKGIDDILVEKCIVNSKNGLNFNNSDNVTVDDCTVDVKGYAVRFGESSGGVGAAETYLIKNSTLKSANDDGDAVIVLRGTADYSTLTIEKTTIEGTPEITNSATDAIVIIDGVATVNSTAGLTAMIKKGCTTVNLAAGDYEMPEPDLRGKTLTIIGSKDAVIDVSAVDARDQFVTGAILKFVGVTLNFGKVNYMGFANTASLTYKDCQINGLQFLFGESVTFENCDFNSNGAEHSVWTYGAKNVNFNECDFTYGDRGINCYSDNDVTGGKQTVNFTDCTFTTTNTASEGAVEINSTYFSVGIEVNLTDCTAPAYGKMAYVSPWDNTNGAKTTINIK